MLAATPNELHQCRYLTFKLLPLLRKAAAATNSATITVVSSYAHESSVKVPASVAERGIHLDEESLNSESNYDAVLCVPLRVRACEPACVPADLRVLARVLPE